MGWRREGGYGKLRSLPRVFWDNDAWLLSLLHHACQSKRDVNPEEKKGAARARPLTFSIRTIQRFLLLTPFSCLIVSNPEKVRMELAEYISNVRVREAENDLDDYWDTHKLEKTKLSVRKKVMKAVGTRCIAMRKGKLL